MYLLLNVRFDLWPTHLCIVIHQIDKITWYIYVFYDELISLVIFALSENNIKFALMFQPKNGATLEILVRKLTYFKLQ